MKNKLHYLVLAISFMALSVSCSKDDESNDPNNNNGGGESDPIEDFVSISVTGDETAEFSSDALTSLSGSPNNGYQFIVTSGSESTDFSISFQSKYVNIPPEPIPAGTFDLIAADDLENGDGNYAVMFTNYDTGTSFGHEVSGTLDITESNDDYLEADFTFTTTSHTNGDEEVTVEGSFLAPRN